ncbi:MAG TPA: hypothetical protein VJ725_01350 [Thermoanaerobaculia bacterium]|nr:hypothetical protein [Thermoanaerobaculia bacterium]
MKQNVLWTLSSVLSVLFFSLHVADDIIRGFEKGGLWNLSAVLTFATWLYGTLVLAERRSGYVIVLLGSLLGVGAPILHFQAAGGVAHGEIARSSGALFFVWTLLALGVCAVFSFVLSAQGLWKLQRGRSRRAAIMAPPVVG